MQIKTQLLEQWNVKFHECWYIQFLSTITLHLTLTYFTPLCGGIKKLFRIDIIELFTSVIDADCCCWCVFYLSSYGLQHSDRKIANPVIFFFAGNSMCVSCGLLLRCVWIACTPVPVIMLSLFSANCSKICVMYLSIYCVVYSFCWSFIFNGSVSSNGFSSLNGLYSSVPNLFILLCSTQTFSFCPVCLSIFLDGFVVKYNGMQ